MAKLPFTIDWLKTIKLVNRNYKTCTYNKSAKKLIK